MSAGEVLDGSIWAALVGAGIRRRYPAGSLLLAEGDSSAWVLAILEGEVVVTVGVADKPFDTIGPGELLGELAALDGLPRTASAWAVTDVDAVAIDAPTFVRLVHTSAPGSLPFVSMEGRRARAAFEWRAANAGGVPVSHLAALLLDRATGPDPVVNFDPARFAIELGTSHELLTRALEFLAGRGAVAMQRGSLVVLDVDALASAAGQARAERSSS